MAKAVEEIIIYAPIEDCFDAARNIERERAIDGKITGWIEEGETVTFEARHFSSPYGLIGWLFDKCVLERYMRAFVAYRQQQLKKLIEEGVVSNGSQGSRRG